MEKTKSMHLVSQKEAVKYFRCGIASAFTYQLFAFLPILLLNKGAASGIKYLILRVLHLAL